MTFTNLVGYLLALLLLCPCIAQAEKDESATISPSQSPLVPAADEIEADKIAKAKELFDQGLKLMVEKRWNEAEQMFRRSNQEVNRPSNTFNIAICLVQQGQIVEGSQILSQLAKEVDPVVDSALHQRIAEIQTKLQSMTSTLEIEVNPESASITLDKKPTSQTGPERIYPLNPGEHVLTVSEKGFSDVRLEFVIDSGKRHKTSVHLTPAPSVKNPGPTPATKESVENATGAPTVVLDDASGANPWPWIVTGFGGALLVSAGVLAVLADAADQDIEDICFRATNCDPANRQELDRLVERRDGFFTASDITLISGVVIVGTGIAWWLFDDDDEPAIEGRAKLNRHHFELSLIGRF